MIRMGRRGESWGGEFVCYEIGWLDFRVFTNAYWINGKDLSIETVHLRWEYIYIPLSTGGDLDVEGKGTQCEGLSQIQ